MTYAMGGWTVLAEPTRLMLFELLVEHPSSVGELARGVPVSRPAVSQHLKILKDAGLIIDAQAGKQRIYRVDPAGLTALRAELDLFWSPRRASPRALAELTIPPAVGQPGKHGKRR